MSERSLVSHTPGPWNIDEGSNYLAESDLGKFKVYGGDLELVVAQTIGDVPELARQEEANAHLISASPDLLEACKEFVRKVECGDARSKRSYAQMKAAIAKAEGRDE